MSSFDGDPIWRSDKASLAESELFSAKKQAIMASINEQ